MDGPLPIAMPSDVFHTTGTGWRLPVELLLQCLLAADTPSRIRASHVSRVWREALLAERRLWDGFSCSDFRDKNHEDVMFAQLQAMLLRSCSLPCHISIPQEYGGGDIDYARRLMGLQAFNVLRLASYRGPVRIFFLLNPTRKPLPSLICLEHRDRRYRPLEWIGNLGPDCLPNIRQLIVGGLSFPTTTAPLAALECLTLRGSHHSSYLNLFTYYPYLVRLEITNIRVGTPLPNPPLPASLRTLLVHCQRPRSLDLAELMRGWRGILLRHIDASEVYTLRGVLPVFLASHTHPIGLRLTSTDHAVIIAAVTCGETTLKDRAQTVWTIHPAPAWAADLLGSIEKPASDRLTSLSVSLARLDALFRAQLYVPRLARIEICLGGASPSESGGSLQDDQELFLLAPSLRRVAFTFDDEYTHSLSAHLGAIRGALATLRESFRALLRYDAGLLDAIMVSRLLESECTGFSHLAKEYIAIARGSGALVCTARA